MSHFTALKVDRGDGFDALLVLGFRVKQFGKTGVALLVLGFRVKQFGKTGVALFNVERQVKQALW